MRKHFTLIRTHTTHTHYSNRPTWHVQLLSDLVPCLAPLVLILVIAATRIEEQFALFHLRYQHLLHPYHRKTVRKERQGTPRQWKIVLSRVRNRIAYCDTFLRRGSDVPYASAIPRHCGTFHNERCTSRRVWGHDSCVQRAHDSWRDAPGTRGEQAGVVRPVMRRWANR